MRRKSILSILVVCIMLISVSMPTFAGEKISNDIPELAQEKVSNQISPRYAVDIRHIKLGSSYYMLNLSIVGEEVGASIMHHAGTKPSSVKVELDITTVDEGGSHAFTPKPVSTGTTRAGISVNVPNFSNVKTIFYVNGSRIPDYWYAGPNAIYTYYFPNEA